VQHLHNTKELRLNAIVITTRAGMNEILVLSTANTLDLAQKIASALVGAHEAACVNIVPGIRSVYYWDGKECNDEEFLLLIKSSAEKFEAVRARIRQLHTYQVPEIIALPITAGDPNYLAWLSEGLKEQRDKKG
jgi:periplasmic divalent cation tolerance protein